METFFITLRIIPTAKNTRVNEIDGALVNCWVRIDDPDLAMAKACIEVELYDWKVLGVVVTPTRAHRDDFAERDL